MARKTEKSVENQEVKQEKGRLPDGKPSLTALKEYLGDYAKLFQDHSLDDHFRKRLNGGQGQQLRDVLQMLVNGKLDVLDDETSALMSQAGLAANTASLVIAASGRPAKSCGGGQYKSLNNALRGDVYDKVLAAAARLNIPAVYNCHGRAKNSRFIKELSVTVTEKDNAPATVDKAGQEAS